MEDRRAWKVCFQSFGKARFPGVEALSFFILQSHNFWRVFSIFSHIPRWPLFPFFFPHGGSLSRFHSPLPVVIILPFTSSLFSHRVVLILRSPSSLSSKLRCPRSTLYQVVIRPFSWRQHFRPPPPLLKASLMPRVVLIPPHYPHLALLSFLAAPAAVPHVITPLKRGHAAWSWRAFEKNTNSYLVTFPRMFFDYYLN